MSSPIPATITSIDPLIVRTIGDVWLNISGTNFVVKNHVPSVNGVVLNAWDDSLQFKVGSWTPNQFQYYVANDTNIWVLLPPVTSFTSFAAPSPSLTAGWFSISPDVFTDTVDPTTGQPNPPAENASVMFQYQYLPGVLSVDLNSPVIWTGETVMGNTVTLNVPSPPTSTLDVTLSAPGAPGITFTPNPVPISNGGTTGDFTIAVPATTTPGPVTIIATLPDGSASTTATISAGQIFMDLQGTYLEDGVTLESGQPVFCTFYVRSPASGVTGGTVTVNSSTPFLPSASRTWTLNTPITFTPTVAKFRTLTFSLSATYNNIHAQFGPYQVRAPIQIKPGPNPV